MLPEALAEVVALERACLTALPAPRHAFDGAFVLKAFLGGTGRANAVCSTDPAPDPDLPARVARIEALYSRLGLACRFRLDAARPAGAGAAAARAAMRDGEETIVHAGPAQPVADPAVRVLDGPAPEWMAVVATAEYQTPARRAEKLRNPDLLAAPGAWMLLREDGVDAACLFAVADGRHCGIFDLATRPEYRRRGLGERLIRAAAHWAAGLGAETVWAQVATTNAASRRCSGGSGCARSIGTATW